VGGENEAGRLYLAMREKSGPQDAAVARVASRQHGVVSVAQLREAGLDKSAISRRVAAGRLHRLSQGVYAVGHLGLSLHGRWMAAVLACGEGAVLSHGSAAALWNLLRPLNGPIDVSVPTHSGRERRRGIRLHRCISLAAQSGGTGSSRYARENRPPSLVTRREGIPVTTVPRTIEDLRGYVAPRLVRRAIREAEFMGLRLDGVESDRSRSDLEKDFLELCHRHGLPAPEVNVKLGRWEVDFLWRDQRLVVETDSFAYHRGSVAFEDDHARDLDLRGEGFTVLRFSERQLNEEPGRVVEDVARALEQEDW
jgi:very-short-patch-repair endonuclease